MALIEVDITDYLDEINTENLFWELESRVKTPQQQLKMLRNILNLKPFHDNERIKEELCELLKMV